MNFLFDIFDAFARPLESAMDLQNVITHKNNVDTKNALHHTKGPHDFLNNTLVGGVHKHRLFQSIHTEQVNSKVFINTKPIADVH